jgi:V8-like Glu-specific endopeptidase
MMQVEQREYRLLNEALVDAFTLQSLDQMLQFGLGDRLENIAAPANLNHTVFELIGYYNRRDRVEKLVQAARRFNPTNGRLHEVAQSLGKATLVTAHLGEETVPAADGKLEALVRRRVPMINSREMRQNMMQVEGRMCIVERRILEDRGVAIGSGFLIGSRTVLTNYHVVKNYLQADQARNLQVRFDALLKEDGVREPQEGLVFDVDKIPAYSPTTEDDALNLILEPAENELDFAILQLFDEAGYAQVGGAAGPGQFAVKRGWMEMPEISPAFAEGDPLIIYQYPGGRELKMAIDTQAVVGTAWKGRRLRYRNNTELGSSGSPVLDMGWKLVALHHAGGPGPEPAEYNEGIPIALIRASVQADGQGHLFGE